MAGTSINWEPVGLSTPLVFSVKELKEVGFVSRNGESLMVRIPENTVVWISEKNSQGQPTNLAYLDAVHPPSKPIGNGNSMFQGINGNGAAHVVGNGRKSSRGRKGGRNHPQQVAVPQPQLQPQQPMPVVKTSEDLKRQREMEARHAEWLAARREVLRKEREEQDNRYRERIARQKQQELEEKARLTKLNLDEEGKKKTCWVCLSEDHVLRRCPDRCKRSECNKKFGPHAFAKCTDSCQMCQQKGHDEAYCPDRCFVCRDDLHLARDCTVTCTLCGEKGHQRRRCEFAYENRGGANRRGGWGSRRRGSSDSQQPVEQADNNGFVPNLSNQPLPFEGVTTN